MRRENAPGGVVFQEIQRFQQLWMWLIIGLVAAIFWIEMVIGVIWMVAPGSIPGEPDRGELPSVLVIWGIFWLLFGVGLPLFIYSIRLIVEVRDDGISLRYSPLYSRLIPFEDVKTCEVRQFRPLRDYGGMGIKWSSDKGWAYFVDGNQGVWIELTNGQRLLIGSQRPEELLGAIQSMQSIGMRGKQKQASV